ncbi:HAD domain-containing protein [Streptomyces sp. JL2001]|uniref:HAD domain-containing protein n=1 Tax=Streptomyces sp. JL2001 TaxID=3342488 RepID=UPI003D80099B
MRRAAARACGESSAVRPEGGPRGVWCVRSQGGGSPSYWASSGDPTTRRGGPSRARRATGECVPGVARWGHLPGEAQGEGLSPHALGLPPLPVVDWPEPSARDERDHRMGLHWKTRPLVAWAAGRPFAWVDDETTDADRAWVAAHHPGEALLHRVDPRRGLDEDDYAALDAWLDRVR